jgi:hypothetical protein
VGCRWYGPRGGPVRSERVYTRRHGGARLLRGARAAGVPRRDASFFLHSADLGELYVRVAAKLSRWRVRGVFFAAVAWRSPPLPGVFCKTVAFAFGPQAARSAPRAGGRASYVLGLRS